MDLRMIVLSLLLLVMPVIAADNNKSDADLDALVTLVYQSPIHAQQQLNLLAQRPLSDKQQLRLQLLKCHLLLQLGDHEAAIALAQQAQKNALALKQTMAIPYFQQCQADGYGYTDNLAAAFPLLDAAISDAKKHYQPQAMVSALRLKGQFELGIGNYTSAIESLRLALDVYPEIRQQQEHWVWPPLAYLYADMASVMYATGDLPQADHYLTLALKEPDTEHKILQSVLVMKTLVALDSGDKDTAVSMLKNVEALLPEIGSPQEYAVSQIQIAAIEFKLGNAEKAERILNAATTILIDHGNFYQLLRVKRIMAQILMAQSRTDEALKYLQSSADIAARLAQYDDLARAYSLKAKIYAETDNYPLAYQSLQLAGDAEHQAQEKLNNTQFMRYKAKLALQEQQQSQAQQQIRATTVSQQQRLEWLYGIIAGLLLIIFALFVWLIGKSRGWHLVVSPNQNGDELQAEYMLHNAKKSGQPFSALLLDIRHVRQVDLPLLQQDLAQKLREQDRLLQYSPEELLLLLPYTSASGAERVLTQLQPALQHWHGAKVHVGIASLTQPDTLQSLLKRARVNQLNRSREELAEETAHSPVR
ncbi:tetratricopeptide repeat protein [Shewanella sp. YIC-542]|uniref:tetratricopeptide repeat protein n=1 Tax=Shewanella mytili TaxID=3377111 RepID=UPI00398E8A74